MLSVFFVYVYWSWHTDTQFMFLILYALFTCLFSVSNFQLYLDKIDV